MDIMIFHIIIQKIISLVFIIGFPFSLIFISHFQIPIIFINDFSSSISHENSILNTSHFSFQLIFINDFFHPIFIHKNAHVSLIFQAISSIFINSFGITIEIFSLVNTSHFCSAIFIINLCLQLTFANPLCSKVNPKYKWILPRLFKEKSIEKRPRFIIAMKQGLFFLL